jgi:hypothetical protein
VEREAGLTRVAMAEARENYAGDLAGAINNVYVYKVNTESIAAFVAVLIPL